MSSPFWLLRNTLIEVFFFFFFFRKKKFAKLIVFPPCCFQVSVDELKALLAKYSSTDQLAQSGVTIAGTRYMYLSSTDKVIRAKKGTSGVHTIKTTQGRGFFLLLLNSTQPPPRDRWKIGDISAMPR